MSQTIAYVRTSTDKQDLGNQKLEILEWAKRKKRPEDRRVCPNYYVFTQNQEAAAH